MDSKHLTRQLILRLVRPVALTLGLLVVLLLGGLPPGEVAAQPVLTFETSCSPDPIRPGETVLMTCTTTIANIGDQTATNLVANIGPSGCSIPNIAFVDLTINGQTTGLPAFTLQLPIGDLAAGATLEASLRVLVQSFGVGRSGGAVDVVSLDDPSVHAGGDVCWDVTADAAAPPTNLRVTKTLLTPVPEPPIFIEAERPAPAGRFGPPPPPRPDDGQPVPLPPPPPNPETVDFEILVENIGAGPATDVEIVDIQTGYGAVLVGADPSATSVDTAAGRATWSVPSLAAGAEYRIVATYGPAPGTECAYAADVVIVGATVAGVREDYGAFGSGGLFGGGVPVGPCGGPGPEGLCYHYPPDSDNAVVAPCDQEVCWTAPPAGGELQPVFEGCDQEYCWFSSPDGGQQVLSACADPVCWLDFGVIIEEAEPAPAGHGGGRFYPLPCDTEVCNFVAPDGSDSIQDYCGAETCWTAPPEGGEYYPVYGCGEFFEFCWFSPPSGPGESQLTPCEYPVQYAVNPPEGSVDLGLGLPPVFFEPACWAVPPPEITPPFFTYVLPCEYLEEFILWLEPPNDGPAFPVFAEGEETQFCWEPVPPEEIPPDVELPPDLLVPVPCEPGVEGTVGARGGSVPAEVVDGVSSPAVLEQGSVEPATLLPSGSSTPAALLRPEQVIPVPPDTPPTTPDDNPTPPRRDHTVQRVPQLVQSLGLTQQPRAQPAAAALPSAGAGPGASEAALPLAAGLALAGVAFAAAGAFGRRRA